MLVWRETTSNILVLKEDQERQTFIAMASSRKRTKFVRVRGYISAKGRSDRDQRTIRYATIDLSTLKHRSTTGIEAFGFLLAISAGAIGLLVGIVLVSLLVKIFFAYNTPAWAIGVGTCLILFCAGTASPLLQRICYSLKRAYLRNTGIIAEATVVRNRHWSYFRGPEHVDLTVIWQHPETGLTYHYECRYTFFLGPLSEKRANLLREYYGGVYFSLIFHPQRPRYFVVETPFVPCWFDILF